MSRVFTFYTFSLFFHISAQAAESFNHLTKSFKQFLKWGDIQDVVNKA